MNYGRRRRRYTQLARTLRRVLLVQTDCTGFDAGGGQYQLRGPTRLARPNCCSVLAECGLSLELAVHP